MWEVYLELERDKVIKDLPSNLRSFSAFNVLSDTGKAAAIQIKPGLFRKDFFDGQQKRVILNRAVGLARSIKTYTGVNVERNRSDPHFESFQIFNA